MLRTIQLFFLERRLVGWFVDFWIDRHPLIRLLILSALCGSVVAFSFNPIRDWWIDTRASAAERALADGRPIKARELASKALDAGKNDSRVLATLLAATLELDDPRQLEVATALVLREDVPDDDRHRAWEVLCSRGGARSLLNSWDRLSKNGRTDESMGNALFERLMSDGAPLEAAKVLARLPVTDNLEREARLLEILLAKDTPEAHREFVDKLVELIVGHPESRRRWLDMLDRLPFGALTESEALTMIQTLRAAGPAEGRDVLRLARCRMRAEPGRADEFFLAALEATTGVDDAFRARWCLDVGRPKAAAGLLPLETPRPERFDLHRDVLTAVGDEDGLHHLFETAAEQTDPTWEGALYLEMLAILEGSEEKAAQARENALRLALRNPRHQAPVDLARRAQALGLVETSAAAWRLALFEQRGPVPLSEQLHWVIAFFADTKQEETLYSVLAAYRALEPDNSVIVAQHDYLACLQGRIEPSELVANLEPFLDRRPGWVRARSLVAVGHLLQEQPLEAREILEVPGRNWSAVAPIHRAIRALVLNACGREAEADRLMEEFRWDELLPSERRVFEKLTDR